MLDLILSVLFSSIIFVIFKLFNAYKVQTLYAIIVNYVVACIVGLLLYKGTVAIATIPQKPWFWGAFALGALFIIVFNLMAATAQKNGVSVASVATKMSLVIPVIVGVAFYKEELGPLKILGIILALAAVYFASVKRKSGIIKVSSFVLPVLVFLGSGIIDVSINYFREAHIAPEDFAIFSATVFAAAAIIGLGTVVVKSIRSTFKINLRNVIGGICLGVPNFFSIYFLLRALGNEDLNSATVFTINNVAIVMCSTLLGILLFKERLIPKNWLGIALAVISIILVALF
ncbi:DMT family transporter [Aggregatimonas sangjinii]|uniref:DMT family transporter n=1 Tax=Aggregatimonas sangjinii TaxID=2583587 RepID=A0A5B7STT8_9FLAO|nr:DMT family transporter [Aggregatimonas sangjinii]QCX00280.1 DMT family transporter [Aggregatimonas sangjinii]